MCPALSLNLPFSLSLIVLSDERERLSDCSLCTEQLFSVSECLPPQVHTHTQAPAQAQYITHPPGLCPRRQDTDTDTLAADAEHRAARLQLQLNSLAAADVCVSVHWGNAHAQTETATMEQRQLCTLNCAAERCLLFSNSFHLSLTRLLAQPSTHTVHRTPFS